MRLFLGLKNFSCFSGVCNSNSLKVETQSFWLKSKDGISCFLPLRVTVRKSKVECVITSPLLKWIKVWRNLGSPECMGGRAHANTSKV